MSSTIYYSINSQNIISEIIDGEAMIINLDNGFYFSMDNVGTVVWRCIEHNSSFNQITAAVINMYEGDSETIDNGVRQLINQLLSEKLILSTDKPPPEDEYSLVESSNEEIPSKLPYIEPTLNKYTDMEDLLLLDPVHDVGETGWPEKPLQTE